MYDICGKIGHLTTNCLLANNFEKTNTKLKNGTYLYMFTETCPLTCCFDGWEEKLIHPFDDKNGSKLIWIPKSKIGSKLIWIPKSNP